MNSIALVRTLILEFEPILQREIEKVSVLIVDGKPFCTRVTIPFLLIVTFLFLPGLIVQSAMHTSLKPQIVSSAEDPLAVEQIFINGNSEFLIKANEYGWSGTGSSSNPILIENMEFRKNANMFSVSNTDLYFQFSNNRLDGIVGGWCAIVLYNVSNGLLSNNEIVNAAVELNESNEGIPT